MQCFKAGAGDALANQGRDGLAVFHPQNKLQGDASGKVNHKVALFKDKHRPSGFLGVRCRTIKELNPTKTNGQIGIANENTMLNNCGDLYYLRRMIECAIAIFNT